MNEQPDCLYVDEVKSLVRSFRRIKQHNKCPTYNPGWPGHDYQIIEKECNRWINILKLAAGKRREPLKVKVTK